MESNERNEMTAAQKFQIQYLTEDGRWQTTRTFQKQESAEREAAKASRNMATPTRVIAKDSGEVVRSF